MSVAAMAAGRWARAKAPSPRYTATMGTSILIRPMERPELDLAVDWAAAEGWNPGLADAEAFYPADPGGFLLAQYAGTPVACMSAVRYGDGFGFVGFYIAHPAMRGRGFGKAVWQAGMARLAGRTVGLDGVVAQQDSYRKSGFRLAWRNVRFEGVLPPLPRAAGVAIADAATVPFERIAAFDRRFFPAARHVFLARWLTLPGHRAKVALRAGALAGLAVARPCRRGTKVGPLYAEDAGCALALLAGLNGPPLPEPVILDVPQINPAAVALVESLGFEPAFETARMYAGRAPDTDLGGLFGVTTFELG
ncbi:GCN5-related N-acetyltransferase [Blastochloris viridis]|uniref:GCN5-related N-acetyltransferase n=1 Tax=Blastochloris viridis TaxID=1079 RepID=A0A182D451_BLAVI|nr:GCN5-related N-acetyltransferase [Blastochloris viridis]